jgi:hypothetical protein
MSHAWYYTMHWTSTAPNPNTLFFVANVQSKLPRQLYFLNHDLPYIVSSEQQVTLCQICPHIFINICIHMNECSYSRNLALYTATTAATISMLTAQLWKMHLNIILLSLFQSSKWKCRQISWPKFYMHSLPLILSCISGNVLHSLAQNILLWPLNL